MLMTIIVTPYSGDKSAPRPAIFVEVNEGDFLALDQKSIAAFAERYIYPCLLQLKAEQFAARTT